MGQLTAGLAHDFDNLRQVVSGDLELLAMNLTDTRLRRLANNATAAVERGAKLTRQLLAFARKTRLEPKTLNVDELVAGFGEMLRGTAGGRVELWFDLDRSVGATRADPVHLEMALLNMVINARDAMPRGGNVKVATSNVRLDEDGLPGGDYVCLSVNDDGEGMPRHVHDGRPSLSSPPSRRAG